MMSHHILGATDGAEATSNKTGIRLAVKRDPRLVAAARELKDRWLEEMNSGRYLPMGKGKYEVSRLAGDQLMQTEGDLRGTPKELPTRMVA
jgi:hypothetical protein